MALRRACEVPAGGSASEARRSRKEVAFYEARGQATLSQSRAQQASAEARSVGISLCHGSSAVPCRPKAVGACRAPSVCPPKFPGWNPDSQWLALGGVASGR